MTKIETIIFSPKNLIKPALLLFFALLVIFPHITFSSAKSGISLWAATLLPALFPAVIVTNIIFEYLNLKPEFMYLYLIIAGLLGGYPLAAIIACRINKYNPKETLSNTLLAYCNISSPSFILNYILTRTCFNSINRPLMLFCIYFPSIAGIAFILIKRKFQDTKNNIIVNSSTKDKIIKVPCSFSITLDKCIYASIKSMLKLCGYIVIFSCITGIIGIFIKDRLFSALTASILEITNGIYLIDGLPIVNIVKPVLIITFNAFGGISTIMQTLGMISGTNLSIKKYIYHKVILALLSFITASIVVYVL